MTAPWLTTTRKNESTKIDSEEENSCASPHVSERWDAHLCQKIDSEEERSSEQQLERRMVRLAD